MKKPKDEEAAPAFRIPPMDERPEGAMALGDIIDQRFKDLLSLSCEPKQLTDALKAATDWYKVKRDADQGEGYGSKLGKGTMYDRDER